MHTCPRCNVAPVVGLSENRREKRAAAEATLKLATELQTVKDVDKLAFDKMRQATKLLASADESDRKKGAELSAEAEQVKDLGTRRAHARADDLAKSLAAEVHEARCPKCRCFVWAPTKEEAETRWAKAVERLVSLKDCCKAATDRRTDADGMTIVRCECGSRHFPLEPHELVKS